jgi:hypothetical protein
MPVTFHSHSYNDTHSVYVKVEGAESIKHTSGARLMAAEHVQCKYQRYDGEDWTANAVYVSGGLLKKDGTPGKQVVTRTFYSFNRNEWPSWLIALVEDSRPWTSASVAREPLVAIS